VWATARDPCRDSQPLEQPPEGEHNEQLCRRDDRQTRMGYSKAPNAASQDSISTDFSADSATPMAWGVVVGLSSRGLHLCSTRGATVVTFYDGEHPRSECQRGRVP